MILEKKEHDREVTILLNLRHGEYGWPTDEKVKEIYIKTDDWGSARGEEAELTTLPEEIQEKIKSDPDWDDGSHWGSWVILKGPTYHISLCFRTLAGQLLPQFDPSGYTPGGDDDYFDYWPGAMEALRDLAIDLDELYSSDSFYGSPGHLAIYDHVLFMFLVREKMGNEGPTARGGWNIKFTTAAEGETWDHSGWIWEHLPYMIRELAQDLKITPDDLVIKVSQVATVLRSLSHDA